MAIQIRHYAIIKDKKIYLHNLPLFEKNTEALEGKRIEFTMKEVHEKPSVDQHAYYRGAVIETALTCESFGGWSGDEVDTYFSNEFLGYNIEKILKIRNIERKITIRKITSKADLDKKGMAEFIDKCISLLAIENIIVHSPEQYKLNKYKTIYGS